HRHDVVSGPRHVLGHVERGLLALGLGLDTQHRDALVLPDDSRDALGGGDEVVAPVAHGPSLAPVLASAREEPSCPSASTACTRAPATPARPRSSAGAACPRTRRASRRTAPSTS